MTRELPTSDSGFSRAYTIPLTEMDKEKIEALTLYYYRLRKYWKGANSNTRGVTEHTTGWRTGIYFELKDLEYFLKLLGKDVTIGAYEI